MKSCAHQDQIQKEVQPNTKGCEECQTEGTRWVALRMCLSCGHVGCCDSSPGRHATGHFKSTTHPIMKSAQPGEGWRWCYVDESYVG